MPVLVDEQAVSAHVVDAAIAVHRVFGPGLLESACAAALAIEFAERGLFFVCDAPINARYRGRPLGVVYRADSIVENKVLIETKAVRTIEDIHIAQVLSYLRLGGFKLGLLLNFNVPVMKQGIKRIVNDL